jgi:hypothetical protein
MTTTFQTQWLESLTDQQIDDMVRFWTRNARAVSCLMPYIESMFDNLDVTLISKETSDLMDKILDRAERGLPIDDDELERVVYALSAATPT